MFDDEVDDGSPTSAWPAFSDLLAATSLLFLVLFSVVALPALQRAGKLGDLRSRIDSIRIALDTISQREDVTVKQVGDYILVQIQGDATFPQNRYELELLRDEGRRILNSFAQRLIADSLVGLIDQVQVVGHASREGSNEQNWFLSASRAATVAMFLIDNAGIPACLVSAVGRSNYYPLDPDGAVSPEDRRIELEIRPAIPADSSQAARRARCVDVDDGR